ncbi:uncharacterized protein [Ptychodera flava]|uniref:uncharacterized protein isoform X2 n=1 Tax=Ptychodera flava TaxID=63121 RepID=UPI00396A0FAB
MASKLRVGMHSIFSKEDVVEAILQNIDEETRTEKSVERYLKCAVGLEDGGLTLDEKEAQEQAERFMDWARGKSLVKVVQGDVPEGIIPSGKAVLLDVKVAAKGAPDDKIYERNKDIRAKVARGNSFLHITSGPHSSLSCIIYALKKFSGGLGDEDDNGRGDNVTWQKYFTKPLDEATHFVATRKANGEAAHFSARHIGSRVVLCGGSKNVHLLFRSNDDIWKHTDSRYKVAKEVCLAIWNSLEEMDEDCRKRLLSFLCHSHFTAVFEILQPNYQHVEDLSHLKQAELKFITWTSSVLEADSKSQLCAVSPHVSMQIAQAVGLSTVKYDVLPIIQLEERMKAVRQGYQYEGEVFYFLDADEAVIGLLKKKTIWYIIVRAIREKVRGACNSYAKSANFSESSSKSKINRRISEIQQWLGLDNQSTRAWQTLGCEFLLWTIKEMKRARETRQLIADFFPVMWKRFLEKEGKSDCISSVWTEPEGSDD